MIFQVVESKTQVEENFYDAQLPRAKFWAQDCARQMKSLTGKDYEVLVKHEDGTTEPLKEYESKQKEESAEASA